MEQLKVDPKCLCTGQKGQQQIKGIMHRTVRGHPSRDGLPSCVEELPKNYGKPTFKGHELVYGENCLSPFAGCWHYACTGEQVLAPAAALALALLLCSGSALALASLGPPSLSPCCAPGEAGPGGEDDW